MPAGLSLASCVTSITLQEAFHAARCLAGLIICLHADLPESNAFLQAVPAAHRGFLLRARQVPIEAMYEHACRQKRRLVLSGEQ